MISLSLKSSSFIIFVIVILFVIKLSSSLFVDNVSNIFILLSSLLSENIFSSIDVTRLPLSIAKIISSFGTLSILEISPYI